MNSDRSTGISESGALITLGDYYGSLAAARTMGRDGVEIHYGDHRRLVPGIWSKYVVRRVTTPAPGLNDDYREFLLRYGHSYPKLFLYPTSDDMCWLLAKNYREFSACFTMWMPSEDVIYSLLNKVEMHNLADKVGVRTPHTICPTSEAELVQALGPKMEPVLLKPRTQIGHVGKGKGAIVQTSADLIDVWRRLARPENFAEVLRRKDVNVYFPMVQKYYPEAVDGIVSVAGVALTPEKVPVLASSMKVFQRPRKTGVGIAFQAIPTNPLVAQCVRSLIQRAKYFGIFEAEFLLINGEPMLLDFNPRYYGQMAFEIARGLPLPLIALSMALGEQSRAEQLCNEANIAIANTEGAKFANGWVLRLLTACQFLAGRISYRQTREWWRWANSREGGYSDILIDWDDPCPLMADILAVARHSVRHPRDFWRKYFGTDL